MYMKYIRSWWPVISWMVIIFLLSSRQRIQVSDEQVINFFVFKTLHVVEYMALFLLTVRALRMSYSSASMLTWCFIAYMITVSHAGFDELHQTFVLTREGHPRDVIIDTIGAVLAWILTARLYPRAQMIPDGWLKRWLALS
jgi:VanZ family protein